MLKLASRDAVCWYLWTASITKLYRLIILGLRPFVMSDNCFEKQQYKGQSIHSAYSFNNLMSVIQGLQKAVLRKISHRGKERGRADIHRLITFTQRSYISRRIWRKYFIPSLTNSAKIIEIIKKGYPTERLWRCNYETLPQNHDAY